MTLTAPAENYSPGTAVTYTVRVRSLATEPVDITTTTSSLDGVTNECTWRNLAPGASAVYNCKPITHVLTAEDAAAGSWTPSIILRAVSVTTGEVLQTLTAAGAPLEVTAPRPDAAPAPAPDASTSLPAALAGPTALATTTPTDNYRIPAITTAPNGHLLVSYDERSTDNGNAGGDSPNPNSIVQRRSTDNGATWSAPTYIHRGTETGLKEGYSDPSYVVNHETGAIHNFHVKSYDVSFQGSQAGTDPAARNVLRAEVSTSRDNGYTWTHRDITAEVDAGIGAVSRFAVSGQGIQIGHGEHAGRLVQQYTVKRTNGVYQAVSLFSDDHGATWRVGSPVGTGMDENKVVELSDGTLMMNSRDSAGSGFRKTALSTDGGATWGPVSVDRNLPDSTDNAQIIRAFPNTPAGDPRASVLLFSNAPGAGRTQGTISMSCDDGRTWAARRVFQEGSRATRRSPCRAMAASGCSRRTTTTAGSSTGGSRWRGSARSARR